MASAIQYGRVKEKTERGETPSHRSQHRRSPVPSYECTSPVQYLAETFSLTLLLAADMQTLHCKTKSYLKSMMTQTTEVLIQF